MSDVTIPQPTRPWQRKRSEVARSGVSFGIVGLLSFGIVLFTGFAGVDGWAVCIMLLSVGLQIMIMEQAHLSLTVLKKAFFKFLAAQSHQYLMAAARAILKIKMFFFLETFFKDLIPLRQA